MAYQGIKAVPAIFRDAVQAGGFRSLLSHPLSNPKVAKNGKLGVLTAPLHLAPASVSGFNVCAMASPGCRSACLHTAGAPQYMAGKGRARIARTRLFFENRPAFMAALVFEIRRHIARAESESMVPAIRLNATSDIPFERVPVTIDGVRFRNVMEVFPTVQFYDYTKITKRAIAAATGAADWPSNYHLTFSLSESNESDAGRVLAAGGNVTVVFDSPVWTNATRVRILQRLPTRYTLGGIVRPVIDADRHDYRPADGSGVICGLRAKGKAIGAVSGFVRTVHTRRRIKGLARAA